MLALGVVWSISRVLLETGFEWLQYLLQLLLLRLDKVQFTLEPALLRLHFVHRVSQRNDLQLKFN